MTMKKGKPPVINSNLIASLCLPKNIEIELITAIIDAVDGYKNKLN